MSWANSLKPWSITALERSIIMWWNVSEYSMQVQYSLKTKKRASLHWEHMHTACFEILFFFMELISTLFWLGTSYDLPHFHNPRPHCMQFKVRINQSQLQHPQGGPEICLPKLTHLQILVKHLPATYFSHIMMFTLMSLNCIYMFS